VNAISGFSTSRFSNDTIKGSRKDNTKARLRLGLGFRINLKEMSIARGHPPLNPSWLSNGVHPNFSMKFTEYTARIINSHSMVYCPSFPPEKF
jgi:hypothetical protein